MQGLREHGKGGGVDVVGRGDAADHRYLSRGSRKNAYSQTGEAVSLGESPRHEKILDLPCAVNPRVIDQRFSVKFKIRLIDEPGAWADVGEQVLRRKGEVVARAHFDNARACSLSKNRIHGKGGHDDKRLVPRIEIRGTKKMNRFVDSVGEKNLCGVESEKTCNFSFNRLALGIARQEFRIERPQPGQHAR